MSTFGPIFVAQSDNFSVVDGGWTSFDLYPRQLGDINGDGRDDIVGFGNSDVYAALGQSNGTFGPIFVAQSDNFSVVDGGWTSFDLYPRQLGDVNGDGRDDIVGFGNSDVYVSLGRSNGTFGPIFVAQDNNFTVVDGGWTSFNQYPRQLGDINGDGRDDIVGFGNSDVYVSLGQSNGTFGSIFVAQDNNFTVVDGGWTSFDLYPRQLGDVNGDGLDDIVGFGNSDVYVSLGQSNGTFRSIFVAQSDNFSVVDGGWTSFNQYPRQLADINGDGLDDIVGFGNSDVYAALGQTNGTFGPIFVAQSDNFSVVDGGWTSFNQYPRQLGDINGDGRNDIVGFGNADVYVALA
ncbi:Ca2+-binding protein, RTX toxin-related [Nostoc flagelliforme CCNUN1]|uniref:Ca2+-binding protein, RTX toxin-related n=1 Tax=Nostoc flagelliforme CCNUN1 TaxID=2038116 RepID=A0A2K8SSZ8_9NOSO|nr:VCBS repeat-containing protein [Nostoc flagelliforme]AUB38470.1 Ca2+-binding protein, RTX toxin-related [Nostoc flagelliforme CCNUN1]